MKKKGDFLIKGKPNDEIWTDERCFISEILNDIKFPNFSLARARVEPGVTTQLHSLTNVEEIYVIQKGEGIAEINGIEIKVKINDKIIIPAGATQRITNTGDDDLKFFCICMPRFTSISYQNMEAEIL